MKKISLSFLTVLLTFLVQAQEKVTFSGMVTDFSENPIDSAIERVMDRNFKDLFLTNYQ